MLNSAVSTYVIGIRNIRQQDKWINLNTNFSELKPPHVEQPGWDIIDILEQQLQNPETFQAVRFGDRTAATTYDDSEPQIGMSEENAGLTTDEEKGTTHHTEWEIRLSRILKKGYWVQDSITVAKYLHFEVEYGENGDRFKIEKSKVENEDDPKTLEVEPEDKQVRTYNVVVVFPDDPEAQKGIAFFESRGSHSVIIPVRDLLKRAFYRIGDKRYFTEIIPFAEKAAIYEAIKKSRVRKLRLLTEAPADEHGERMTYEGREIVYFAPTGRRLLEYLSTIVANGFSQAKCDIQEISEFNPYAIKIEVTSSGGRRKTYTVGSSKNGIMQEPLEGVVDPDGSTNTERFIKKVEEIYKEQHVRL